MLQTAIFPSRYVQNEGVLAQLPKELARLGRNVLIVAGGHANSKILPPYLPSWREHGAFEVEPFGGECTEKEIDRLTQIARQQECDVIVGMGGGKVIDTAKAVGHAASAKVAIVPTVASMDAPTSAIAVLYTDEGAFQKYLFFPRNPDLVLVDTKVIAEAPVRLLLAGMGDALATWFEAKSCRQAYTPNQCGGLGTLAGYALARLCYDTILEYGLMAKTACEQKVVTPALSHVVEANTLLSGLGFESGGLATAHSIHNGLTELEGTHGYFHGEKVTIGVFVGLFLTDQPKTLVEEVYDFCESVGLPTTLAEIGLDDVSDADLRIVAERACSENETIHHEPCPVNVERVLAAMQMANRYGCARKHRVVASS